MSLRTYLIGGKGVGIISKAGIGIKETKEGVGIRGAGGRKLSPYPIIHNPMVELVAKAIEELLK